MKIWMGLAAFALAMNCSGVRADENTLTPKEISDGWISLFDGNTTFGWKARGDAKWQVAEGEIQCSEGGAGMLATTSTFADYELKAEVWIDAKANSGIMLRAPVEQETAISPTNAYEANIYDAHKEWPSGSINGIKKGRAVKTVGKWSKYEVTANGDHLVIKINGTKTLDIKDAKYRKGVVAMQYYGQGGTVKFRNIKLKPLGLKSLFNGKDLTGWYVLPDPRLKSVFTVTPEGWMNVKNGAGEIQSEAQFQNFVYQMDIFSNGTSLNSGVFFRELPKQFWQGYESQIRNQWQGDDRTKPVDFGTGGLYNRQPTRKVIPSDKEWFTKTIVANGKHIAIWINGFQTVDFDDEAPDKESARQGRRLGAGVIGLQGHDPTTDLSFRNIKAVELP